MIPYSHRITGKIEHDKVTPHLSIDTPSTKEQGYGIGYLHRPYSGGKDFQQFMAGQGLWKGQNNFAIIPYGYENSTSYQKGTAFGPEAIIAASHEVEAYDYDSATEVINHLGVETLSQPHHLTLRGMYETIHSVVARGLTPVTLGGEHTLTPFCVDALIDSLQTPIQILYLDAHADLHDKYDNTSYSHACALRHCLDNPLVKKAVLAGVRNITKEEVEYIRKEPRLSVYMMQEWDVSRIVNEFDPHLPLYISFDVDVLDSAVMPATGTPEPGGVWWEDVVSLYQEIGKRKLDVIGLDFMEFAPLEDFSAPDFTIAKLIYVAMIALFFKHP